MRISEDLIEKYLLGNADLSEKMEVELAASIDPRVEERLIVAKRFAEMIKARTLQAPPTERIAAKSEDSRCVILCERHVVKQKNPNQERTLFTDAKEEHAFSEGLYLTEKGTALHNIGRIMEENGLATTRHYNATLDDLMEALEKQEGIIAVVNEDTLLGKKGNGKPDHAVCVESIGETSVCLFNPSTGNEQDEYPLKDFQEAWNTSDRYAVFANTKAEKTYNPKPLQMFEDIELDEGLNEVGDAIAEYVHDVWSQRRFEEGYVYGPETNTDKKKGPLTNKYLVPFSELSEVDQDLDREVFRGALKMVIYLGYLLKRSTLRCPDCGEIIYSDWDYCAHCGRELQLSDFKEKKKDW